MLPKKRTLEELRDLAGGVSVDFLTAFAKRREYSAEIAGVKQAQGLDAFVPDQHKRVLEDLMAVATGLNIPHEVARGLINFVLDDSVAIQRAILGEEPPVNQLATPIKPIGIVQGTLEIQTGEDFYGRSVQRMGDIIHKPNTYDL